MGYTRSLYCLLSLVVFFSACKRDDEVVPPETKATAKPLSVLVLDDTALAESIGREWGRRHEMPLEIRESTTEKLLEAKPKNLRADVIVFAPELLGTLADRQLILPMADETRRSPELAWGDVLPSSRLQQCVWGKQVFAVPLGTPYLSLYVRPALLKELQFEPPTTWEEYDAIREALSNQDSGEERRLALEPLWDGWAAKLFLARAAGLATRSGSLAFAFEPPTMTPRISNPEFVVALKDMAKSRNDQPNPDIRTPEDVLKRFYEGSQAMAIAWPAKALDIKASSKGVRILPLPSKVEANTDTRHVPVLGMAGKLAAVSRSTSNPKGAWDLATWLSRSQVSADISTASSEVGPCRKSHLQMPQVWLEAAANPEMAQQYAGLISTIQDAPQRMQSLRIPGYRRYMQALDQTVLDVLFHDADPKEALEEVAKEWDAITDEIGRDEQVAAMGRSIGLLEIAD